MLISCAGMRHSVVIILILTTRCTFSQAAHEYITVVGCFDNGPTEVTAVFNAEELMYADFERQVIEYTVPPFLMLDPGEVLKDIAVYKNAKKVKNLCLAIMAYCRAEEKNPPEEKDPPESILYPAEEVQRGVENLLICFVNHFYPPYIEVSWTKNGHPVSEGVSLSRYYSNDDLTFRQFSTMTFTPREGDIYSCTVEHSALETPTTRIWEPDFSHHSHGPDVFCGVGLAFGLIGVAAVEPYVRLRSAELISSRHPIVLICSVYNFYPKNIRVTWLRNGEPRTSDVTFTDELANGNWLYQIHSHLEYTPRLGEKITCMVEHASFKDPKHYDWDPMPESDRVKIAVGTAGLLLGSVVLLAGVIYYKRNRTGRVLVPVR
ncbi:putative h-2 class II histocompatibility antigen A-B alpha chain-like [Scophthalmus maximus]|uniref:Putative h-2 class II histocompatibility antigen A-B alpha chain-like n=1 Tax=Scophthalmus maximus TaxID=52904 RepID=A0A2U9AY78_SCOMX|nr:putative h-2 class II histocompatibility antigen A-B alpha chain-like [Scophthalmus maximus]